MRLKVGDKVKILAGNDGNCHWRESSMREFVGMASYVTELFKSNGIVFIDDDGHFFCRLNIDGATCWYKSDWLEKIRR